MNPKYYCPICHGRIEKPMQTYLHEGENGPIIITYYLANHTEPICNGLCVLQQYKAAYPQWATKTEVPDIFQEAFDEDIEP